MDLDEDLNEYVAGRGHQEGSANIEVILAKPDDPRLPAPGVDLIFTSDTYHHIQNRVNYFTNVRRYLRPNGRIAVVEFNGKGWFEGLSGHYTPPDTIKREMEKAGYHLQRQFDFLPKQSFLIFSKNG